MATPDKERLYNPSEWSKRYASQQLMDYFFKFCAEVTEKARETIKCELNIPYDKTERTKYDIYGTNLPKDAPIFIFVHGGYWKECSKDFAGFSVPLFVKNNIKVITVGYDLCPNVTEEARKTFKCELNVPYGVTEGTKYDIYGTDLPKDAPIFVFIPGGYWQEFGKDLLGFSVPLFVKNKIKVITVGYDLCPRVKVWDIVAEVKAAVAQILKYATDSGCRSVWIGGHSVGAHLAASFLHDDNWIKRMTQQGHIAPLKGLVLIAGLYDIRPLLDISYLDRLHLTYEEAKTLSWFILDEPKDRCVRNLKVIVTVGAYDSPTYINESRQYAQKIISLVDNVEFLFLRKTDHFDIVENLLNPNNVLAKLLLKSLQSDANTK